MDEKTLTLQLPSEIDGDPLDVEKSILDELSPALDQFAGYIDAVVTQLANAERTRIVRADKAIDPLELRNKYDESDRADTLTRLTKAAKDVCAAGSELEI